jgi:uncharacterized protein YutE (UPF0331/DUF86 family)
LTELDGALVRRKLNSIVRNLRDLGDIESLSLAEYRGDRFRQKGTERLLQEIVDAAVDLNLHILRALGCPAPSDYFQSFIQLGTQGIVSDEFAALLAPAAGLRNRLVHEYDDIDDAKVLEAVTTARQQFGDYVGAVEQWLNTNSP